MVTVCNRKLAVFNKVFRIITIFYSHIIIKKLNNENLNIFRKVEKLSKLNIKRVADIKYLEFCDNNQLLPKFLNFKLYDVSLHHDECTLNFKKKLLKKEITKKNSELTSGVNELGKQLVMFRNKCRGLHYYSSLDKYKCNFSIKRRLPVYIAINIPFFHKNKPLIYTYVP